MDSDTSSDKNKNNKQTSETDFYLNLLANENKKISENNLDLNNILDSDKSDSSKSSTSSRRSTVSLKSNKSDKSTRSNKSDISVKSNRNNSYSPFNYDKPKALSPQELKLKKIELLRKLSELKSKGYNLSKEYDFNSSLEDMEYEYELLKSFVTKRNGIKLYKNIIINGASLIEFMNDRYDPFGAQLDGWSEHMSIEVESYDEVLEQLYEKYKSSGKEMPPELKLIFLMVTSATAFHFSKSHLSNIPGLNKVLEKNPDLIANLVNQQNKSNFVSQEELYIQEQRKQAQQRDAMFKQQMMAQNTTQNTTQNNNTQVNNSTTLDPPDLFSSMMKKTSNSNVKIELPNDVNDILGRNMHPNLNSDTQEETTSNNDRLMSDSLVSSASKRGRKKKNMMVIE